MGGWTTHYICWPTCALLCCIASGRVTLPALLWQLVAGKTAPTDTRPAGYTSRQVQPTALRFGHSLGAIVASVGLGLCPSLASESLGLCGIMRLLYHHQWVHALHTARDIWTCRLVLPRAMSHTPDQRRSVLLLHRLGCGISNRTTFQSFLLCLWGHIGRNHGKIDRVHDRQGFVWKLVLWSRLAGHNAPSSIDTVALGASDTTLESCAGDTRPSVGVGMDIL
mmetsp:Transcript_30786/g.56304  ORF Transcript_30786/g.56304 Transcript_30786/m.56304 type:complete len:223 (+) Transcript_30786:742-1410(+)